VKIAVDAIGGDHAPRVVVEGAQLAVGSGFDPEAILLVGQEDELRPLMDQADLSGVEILNASQVVAMDESPSSAIRSKQDSSIVVGMQAVKRGAAQGFVSAGNTGAVVAAAQLTLGRLTGVSRPGIAVPIPTDKGPCIVIDVGANIYCKPLHMQQYAIMATEYVRAAFDRKDASVGLLNIGAEEGKGNPLILEVHDLLRDTDLNYKGFVEGQDIMTGELDVVVCEGFVGNVILKVAEGLAAFVTKQVSRALATHPPRPEVKQALGEAFASLDYSEYGGAPLLGVGAPVIIGHGRSSAHAIMNMLRVVESTVNYDVTGHITERLRFETERTAS
jgi:glycerol-3-phosphate acyltransferase PlsX